MVRCIRSSNIHWAYSPSCERSGCCWMLNFGPFSLPPHTSFIFWQIILQLDCWTKKSHHFSGIIALLNHPWLCTLCLRICDRYPHCLGFILFTFSMPRQHHSPRRYNLRGLIEHMFSRGWYYSLCFKPKVVNTPEKDMILFSTHHHSSVKKKASINRRHAVFCNKWGWRA